MPVLQTDGRPRDWVARVKGGRGTDGWLQNSRGDGKCSVGNVVNNVAVTLYGTGWALGISGGTLGKVYDCLTVLYT